MYSTPPLPLASGVTRRHTAPHSAVRRQLPTTFRRGRTRHLCPHAMSSLFTKFTFLMYTVCLQAAIYLAVGVLSTIYLMVAWFKGYFHRAKERDIPPPCLRDPALGWHRFVKLKNVKLHYVEAGDSSNPLVVLIHGAPDFWFTWRKQIPSLANNYWVVAVDLRGCGDSDTPSLRTQYTIDIITEDIVHLIGSLGVGGQVGWRMVQRYPGLVSKMVLVHSPHPYIVQQQIHSLWKYAALLNDNDLIDKILKPLIRTKAVSEQEIEAYKFTFSRRGCWEKLDVYGKNIEAIDPDESGV
ncbi:putative epoxide hydrolase 4 [Penaeus vannamei]|uniref:Putative epoxide hydrolase 4 n=1 Tax=Penaeus vannamei TaxID=6689 RepID=A0A3R7LY83_PENVA|nr:putative epoxide hydrolase 4 [Penaeus vannamei]